MMSVAKRKAIAIEVGMQNSGMVTTQAASCFPSLALATVPGAIFRAFRCDCSGSDGSCL